MTDPRLNSLHLDPNRRQDYRRARDQLLHARGNETICAERQREDDSQINNTLIRQSGAAVPVAVECWLTDGEFVYPLKIGLNTMGRSADNDVIVEDLYVSRRHCAILVHHDNKCELQDTASKNGTFINSGKIAGPTTLQPGDRIRICNREYVFHNRAAVPAGPPLGVSPTRTIAG